MRDAIAIDVVKLKFRKHQLSNLTFVNKVTISSNHRPHWTPYFVQSALSPQDFWSNASWHGHQFSISRTLSSREEKEEQPSRLAIT